MTINAPPSAMDINIASITDLQALLGVTAEIAALIEHGRPWTELDDLRDIAGLVESDIATWPRLVVPPVSSRADTPAALSRRPQTWGWTDCDTRSARALGR